MSETEQKSIRPKATKRESRVVGLDFGLARIGVAISDAQKIIAMPLFTLKCEQQTVLTVQKLVRELEENAKMNQYEIEEIVIGMPFLMNGKKGILADEVAHFIQLLQLQMNVPLSTWDERLTSVQAERSLREGNMTRKKRSKYVDVVAAALILQNYLDYKTLRTS